MPLPKPHAGEQRDDFISRCHSALASEFPDESQRSAVCFAQWCGEHSETASHDAFSGDDVIKDTTKRLIAAGAPRSVWKSLEYIQADAETLQGYIGVIRAGLDDIPHQGGTPEHRAIIEDMLKKLEAETSLYAELHDVPVFEVGTHTDSAGKTRQWSTRDLRTMLQHFTHKTLSSIPIKLGHTSEEYNERVAKALGVPPAVVKGESGKGAARLGYVKALRMKGNNLVADVQLANEKVAELVRNDYFNSVSPEIKFLPGKNGVEPILGALSLLGAQRPALASNNDALLNREVTALDDGSMPDAVYEFGWSPPQNNYQVDWSPPQNNYQVDGDFERIQQQVTSLVANTLNGVVSVSAAIGILDDLETYFTDILRRRASRMHDRNIALDALNKIIAPARRIIMGFTATQMPDGPTPNFDSSDLDVIMALGTPEQRSDAFALLFSDEPIADYAIGAIAGAALRLGRSAVTANWPLLAVGTITTIVGIINASRTRGEIAALPDKLEQDRAQAELLALQGQLSRISDQAQLGMLRPPEAARQMRSAVNASRLPGTERQEVIRLIAQWQAQMEGVGFTEKAASTAADFQSTVHQGAAMRRTTPGLRRAAALGDNEVWQINIKDADNPKVIRQIHHRAPTGEVAVREVVDAIGQGLREFFNIVGQGAGGLVIALAGRRFLFGPARRLTPPPPSANAGAKAWEKYDQDVERAVKSIDTKSSILEKARDLITPGGIRRPMQPLRGAPSPSGAGNLEITGLQLEESAHQEDHMLWKQLLSSGKLSPANAKKALIAAGYSEWDAHSQVQQVVGQRSAFEVVNLTECIKQKMAEGLTREEADAACTAEAPKNAENVNSNSGNGVSPCVQKHIDSGMSRADAEAACASQNAEASAECVKSKMDAGMSKEDAEAACTAASENASHYGSGFEILKAVGLALLAPWWGISEITDRVGFARATAAMLDSSSYKQQLDSLRSSVEAGEITADAAADSIVHDISGKVPIHDWQRDIFKDKIADRIKPGSFAKGEFAMSTRSDILSALGLKPGTPDSAVVTSIRALAANHNYSESRFAAMEKQLGELRHRDRVNHYLEETRKLHGVTGTPAELAEKLVKFEESGGGEPATELLGAWQQASIQFEKARLNTRILDAAHSEPSNFEEEIKKLSAAEKLGYAEAYRRVSRERPELYREYKNGAGASKN